MSLVKEVAEYAEWRDRLSRLLNQLEDWLSDHELSDAQVEARLQRMRERLRDDRLVVAFLAEFSRGKSELINAVFFSGYGARVLPSSAGRTTMCPTELQWNADIPPCIDLLPIESRAGRESVADLKLDASQWHRTTLDPESLSSMQEAVSKVGEQIWVSTQQAEQMGFAIGQDGLQATADNQVEVPRWRHAIINFPHPLLEKGLVILDTPGLNAIGAEPELTLSLLPSAHAVLFILAADTGVTQSDLSVWRDHVRSSQGTHSGRLVALNKIDGLWDGLRSEQEIDAEVQKQITSCARTLDLPESCIYPVSAQKGLAAKINNDVALLQRSRLPALEHALAHELIPTKRAIVKDTVMSECSDVLQHARAQLEARLGNLREQRYELDLLRGKNQNVVQYIMGKVQQEKEEFESSLKRYYATRSVFSNLTNKLYADLGMTRLREQIAVTRDAMYGANFSLGLKDAMGHLFEEVRGNLRSATSDANEITTMLEVMHKRFQVEHRMQLGSPLPFSLTRYNNEVDRLEKAFRAQFGTVKSMLTLGKTTLTQKFFETIAVQLRRTFEVANRDAEQWLRSVMAPLESQIREHQMQLRRRLESMKRVHAAASSLDERLHDLQQVDQHTTQQLEELKGLQQQIVETTDTDTTDVAQAA